MTRAILFLGFSFNDPNIEILLRLARSTLRLEKPEHYTILRRPSQGQEVMEHMLRVTDLQRSGVGVVEIEDYGEHEDLLTGLVRRTRPPRLFITGSGTAARDVHQICGAVAHALAALKLQAHSLSGLAARLIKITLGERLIKESGYDPSSLVFHYRRTESGQAPVIDRRIGTVVFWDERDKDLLRRDLIGECRLLLVIGGGAGTAAETSIARQLDIPIVPMPRSGGVAEVEYNKGRPAWVRSQRDWALLNDDDAVVAASAAARLIAEGMHLDGLLRL